MYVQHVFANSDLAIGLHNIAEQYWRHIAGRKGGSRCECRKKSHRKKSHGKKSQFWVGKKKSQKRIMLFLKFG